jgi:hypothetical protein
MLCALLLGLCLLATWPVAEIGINDDWSYIRTAQVFAQTHHFVYNGWATAMLGWQVVWGAWFAHLFGPGFTSIRLSDIPIALAAVLLYRVILRRFGLNRAHATFGTLTLALSPLFLALSDTFMSDIPGMFSILLCLYLCQRALAAKTDTETILWLAAAALTNILSGSVRQIAWLGVLLMVPCCAWLLRRRRGVIPATIILWLVGAVSIKLMLGWFLKQPYALPEKLFFGATFSMHSIKRLVSQVVRSALTTLLFCLPVLATGVAAVWRRPRPRLRIGGGLVLLALLWAALRLMNQTPRIDPPWLGNIVTANGIMQGGALFGSNRALPEPWAVILLFLFALCLLAFAEMLWSYRTAPPPGKSQPSFPEPQARSWHAMAILLLPVALSYALLLVPRAMFLILFDRYLLIFIAIALLFALRWHQERVSARLPAIAVAVLVLFALIAITSTHDLFAMSRAEVRLANALRQAGVPRSAIDGGFDFDAITQVDQWGYLNEWRIANPPGAYHPLPPPIGSCAPWYETFVPAVHPQYELAADPTLCLGPGGFAPVSYHTWLPLATRQLYIGTILRTDDTSSRP